MSRGNLYGTVGHSRSGVIRWPMSPTRILPASKSAGYGAAPLLPHGNGGTEPPKPSSSGPFRFRWMHKAGCFRPQQPPSRLTRIVLSRATLKAPGNASITCPVDTFTIASTCNGMLPAAGFAARLKRRRPVAADPSSNGRPRLV
jgi:hypothetical protein